MSIKKDWEMKRLGEVCDTGAGGTPLKSHGEYYLNGDIPWLRSGEVCDKNIENSELYITKEGLNNSSAKIFPVNTVLIAMYGATAGQVGILKFESSTNQAVCGIFPNNKIVPEFLYYYFSYGKENLVKQAVGGAQPNISQEKIRNTKIPVLSTLEQKRIVGVLDGKFAGIGELKKIAEEQLASAKELFESRLNEVFENENKKWIQSTLKDLTIKIGSGATPRGGKKAYKNEGISLVRSLNVHDSNFKYNKLAYIDNQQADKLNNVTLQKSDVLLNITGASVARCCVVPEDVLPARVNQHVSIIRPKMDIIVSGFLQSLLVSQKYKKQLLGIGEDGGSTRQAITKVQIEDFVVLYPEDMKEQKQIVKELDELSEKTKALEVIFRRKITSLEELKKSYLQEAFAGKL